MKVFNFTTKREFLRTYSSPMKVFTKSKNTTAVKHKSAGVLIIGNEILKAQVKDTNSNFICRHLYRCGVKVEKISVIGDNVDEIAKEIKEFSCTYDHVITSGGLGPTHDDVTYEALAQAFGDRLHYHPTLVGIIKKHLKVQSPSSPAFKLAQIPEGAVLKFGINSSTSRPLNFPCVILENVYLFPGSPVFLQSSFGSLYKVLFGTKNHFIKEELSLDAREDAFADALTTVQREFPNVVFGSYPEDGSSSQQDYLARVTIESDSEEETKLAKDRFCSLLSSDIKVNKIE